ncbi:MAG: type II restriction endonuclease [Bacteroidota bacterium]
MESILTKAIESAQQSEIAYCKFLAANDTKATNAHQSGYLISKSAWRLFLNHEPQKGENLKEEIIIKWQSDFETSSTFTYYGAAKNEFRLTNFGRNFPFREEDNVGDLFVLCKKGKGFFEAYIISTDEEIDEFFAALNISATETNGIIPKQFEATTEDKLMQCFLGFLKSLKFEFPTTVDLATNSRNCYLGAYSITSQVVKANPDREILNWLHAEFQLFKVIENDRYNSRIKTPFKTVEELVETANTILNRRKSRAGKSLEHHLSEIFRTFQLSYATQAVTEDNKKPDFLFPNVDAYYNEKFSAKKLVMLASKTTCKDRWRQILNEADRIKTKHLFTLQQGISKNQLEEMYKYNVCLVVPKQYLTSFPADFRERILTLDSFVNHIQATQK